MGGWKDDFQGQEAAKDELDAWIEKNAAEANVPIPYE